MCKNIVNRLGGMAPSPPDPPLVVFNCSCHLFKLYLIRLMHTFHNLRSHLIVLFLSSHIIDLAGFQRNNIMYFYIPSDSDNFTQ